MWWKPQAKKLIGSKAQKERMGPEYGDRLNWSHGHGDELVDPTKPVNLLSGAVTADR
jgi:hypothetical protein